MEPSIYEAAIWYERQRDQLRAILAPLLDAPSMVADYDQNCRRVATSGQCIFCDQSTWMVGEHAPTCPVLRRDELLGRT